MVDSNQKSVVRQLKQKDLCLPPKRQQRRGGTDLCWQTVSRPRRSHRKEGCTQPVPKAVNHTGFYDKHNCPQRDSIPGPRALQWHATDHWDLEFDRRTDTDA